jgi:hypothetical protein
MRGDGNGVQVLRTAGATFVHVIVRPNGASGDADRSTLLQLQGNALAPLASFGSISLVSVDRTGRFLLRDTDHSRSRKRTDRVIDADGQVVLARDLGHYDCFNHYLRLDGGDALYFLRGTPPTSHEGKVLCRVDGAGHVEKGRGRVDLFKRVSFGVATSRFPLPFRWAKNLAPRGAKNRARSTQLPGHDRE